MSFSPAEIQQRILRVCKAGDVRTVGGIARDSGLSTEEVEKFVLSHPEMFKPFSIVPSGIATYSTTATAS